MKKPTQEELSSTLKTLAYFFRKRTPSKTLDDLVDFLDEQVEKL